MTLVLATSCLPFYDFISQILRILFDSTFVTSCDISHVWNVTSLNKLFIYLFGFTPMRTHTRSSLLLANFPCSKQTLLQNRLRDGAASSQR